MNYERFVDQKAWNLTKQLDKTPSTNTKAYLAVMSNLQKTFLQNLPAIPLWYNGMWSMTNTTYWTNWPSNAGVHYTPSSWRNYFQLTSIDMLTHLKPASARRTDRRSVTTATPLPMCKREGRCALVTAVRIGSSGEAISRTEGVHLPRHVLGGRHDRLGNPALHARRSRRAASLSDAGAAFRDRRR